MGKRKRRQKAGEEGEAETEKPVLPQVRPTFSFRLATDFDSQKRHYRQRAHANPFSDHVLDYPARPEEVDWSEHFPDHPSNAKAPEFADVGCGFGGLLVALSPLLPETLMLGKRNLWDTALSNSSTHTQGWRSASRLHNMCAIAL